MKTYCKAFVCKIIRMLSQILKSKPVQHCDTDISINKKYRPWLPIPLSLFSLTGNIVDNFPLPPCWYWSTDDVINWLQNTICLPQYTECFVKNFINGKRLLLIDASRCVKIGIQKFEHIKLIMDGIRKLYNVEQERFNRSISLPPRYPWTHFLLYKIPTGPIREKTKCTELFQKMRILHFENCCPIDHWKMISTKWLDFPNYLFGLTNHKNVYIRKEHIRQPRGHSYYKNVQHYPSYFIQPNIN